MRKAFTLVELLVTITILVIVTAISFISYKSYTVDSKDAKRLADITNLLWKIDYELIIWDTIGDLIINTRNTTLQVLWKPNNWVETFGVINFKSLKESQEDFKDPTYPNQDYLFAYLEWLNWTWASIFIQAATINEKKAVTIIKGNYYTRWELDATSLFEAQDWYVYKNNDDRMIYWKWWESVIIACARPIPSWEWVLNTIIWEPSRVNQKWQNTDKTEACYYSCDPRYFWENCSEKETWNAPQKTCTLYAQTTNTPKADSFLLTWTKWEIKYFENEWVIAIANGTWTGYIIMDKNLWATENDPSLCTKTSCLDSITWCNFQWWRNVWFSTSATVLELNWDEEVRVPIQYTLWNTQTDFIWNDAKTNNPILNNIKDWSIWNATERNNLWWWVWDSATKNWPWNNLKRQWPCPLWYHVPSIFEWVQVHTLWWWGKDWLKMSTDLKLPLAWNHIYSDKFTLNRGDFGLYWTSSPSGGYSHFLYFNYTAIDLVSTFNRSSAHTVRCFKNLE